MALWVGKERALKPFLQLFITLDQKVFLIPELRFPIATLLNKKKVIFLPGGGFRPHGEDRLRTFQPYPAAFHSTCGRIGLPTEGILLNSFGNLRSRYSRA